jgi:hypothetical protein
MKAKKGRPVGSIVRQHLIEILYCARKAYGYELYKHYCAIYPEVTMRVVYYNLKKGASLGEFKVEEIKHETGDYSWGKSAEKTYYTLGPNAKPKLDKRVKEHFDKHKFL